MPDGFDVFLSHNSQDKPLVEEIGRRLHEKGLRVWLDKWELRPGFPWQEGIEEGIQASRAVAVFVGAGGLGSWQEPEMRAFLTRARREKVPVIPVLLAGCPDSPQLSLFLEALTWVDLRAGLTEEGLARLIWGITGAKGEGAGAVAAAASSGLSSERRKPSPVRVWGLVLSLLAALALGIWLWPRFRKPLPFSMEPAPRGADSATQLDRRPEESATRLDPPPATGEAAASRKPAPLPAKPALYAVRVQVLDPQGRPVDKSTIHASAGHEPQRAPDGWWEIEIPAAKIPADGRISLWAEHPEWAVGRADLRLGADPNPRAEINLNEPKAWLRGQVVDGSGRGLPGARVFRQGGTSGVVVTDAEGHFALELAVAPEKKVRLRVEHEQLPPGEAFCFAGRDTCSILLEER